MINLESEFSPRVNPADANYPFGSIKDNSSPGANDGTPLAAVWGNDWEGFAQAAASRSAVTPSGLSDTAQDSQLLEALDKRYLEIDYQAWTFADGGLLTDCSQAVKHTDNKWYSWGGNFPHTVAPGADPTLTGSGYVPRTDVLLRSELLSSVLVNGTDGLSLLDMVSPRSEGADKTGANDSAAAFNTVIAPALTGQVNVAAVKGTYKLTTPAQLDYTGAGQLTDVGMSFSGPSRLTPVACAVFNVITDYVAQQNTKFIYRDFTSVGAGVAGECAVKHKNTCFGVVENVYARNSGAVVNLDTCGMWRIDGAWAFDSVDYGFRFNKVRDTYVSKTHAYNCDVGYSAEGTNNVATDGNVCIGDSVANACRAYGFHFKGVYTPILHDAIAEQCPTNIKYESSQFGLMHDVFIGPAPTGSKKAIDVSKATDMATNDYNIFHDIIAQNEISLTDFNFSIIHHVSMQGVASSISGGAVYVKGAFNVIDGLNIRNISVPYSVYIEAGSSSFMKGGYVDKPILLAGNSASRGQNVIEPSYAPSVTTGDGLLRQNEYVRYHDGSRIRESGHDHTRGLILPYVAVDSAIPAAGSAMFDVTTIINAGGNGQASYTEAEIIVSGGSFGSTSAAKFAVMRSYDGTKISEICNIGSRGSLAASASGNVITIANNNGGMEIPYRIVLTKLDRY